MASGELALLVINKSATTDLEAEISLRGVTPGSATAAYWRYGKPEDLASADLTAGSIPDAGELFTHLFPAYSMTVIQLVSPLTALENWRQTHFLTTLKHGSQPQEQPKAGE